MAIRNRNSKTQPNETISNISITTTCYTVLCFVISNYERQQLSKNFCFFVSIEIRFILACLYNWFDCWRMLCVRVCVIMWGPMRAPKFIFALVLVCVCVCVRRTSHSIHEYDIRFSRAI